VFGLDTGARLLGLFDKLRPLGHQGILPQAQAVVLLA